MLIVVPQSLDKETREVRGDIESRVSAEREKERRIDEKERTQG